MDVIEKIRDLVKPQYDKLNCWNHNWIHIETVVNYAKKISHLKNTKINSCIIAAYCHDLGRIEEEKRKQRGDNPLPHALLSIEPTVKVLQEVGISGTDFAEIVEAVAVHSYKIYDGENMIAKILQDADKMAGIKTFCLSDLIDLGGKKYLNPEEIVKSWDDSSKLFEFSVYLLRYLKDEAAIKEIERVSRFMMEYKEMFHTEHAFELIKEEYEYLLKFRELLEKKFNL